jgi:hypothetical protein
MCAYFADGDCKKGNACPFAHAEDEMLSVVRYLLPMPYNGDNNNDK